MCIRDRLKEYAAAILCGIAAGVAASAASIFVIARCWGLSRTVYVTLLPKSITTAIGTVSYTHLMLEKEKPVFLEALAAAKMRVIEELVRGEWWGVAAKTEA